MNRLIRYWNQNRKKIIMSILIVASLILLVKVINYLLEKQPTEVGEPSNVVIQDESIPSQSVISGMELPESVTTYNTNIIKEFVDFCNNGQYEQAYNLLSDDCKTEVFSTLEDFKIRYCQNVFNTKKKYELELWYSTGVYVYRIVYYDNDILSTGQVNPETNVEDYISIVMDENGESKLNINGFIDKKLINNSQEIANIKITINDRKQYRSYETFEITVENNTDNLIMLAEGNNSNDICLIDNNEVEYDSFINEIALIDLQVEPHSSKTLNIKFNKMYEENRTISNVCFKNIIYDLEESEENTEKAATILINIAI